MAPRPQLVRAENIYFNALIYGVPGVGKTSFAAAAQGHPALGPVLFLNIEGGLLSVAGRGDIHAVDIRTISEFEEVFWALARKEEGFAEYRTVVIDSVSELQNRSIQEIVRMAINARRGGQGRTLDDIQIEDYGKSTAQLRRLLGWYRDLPINTIITALAKSEYPKGADPRVTAPTEVVPSLTRKLCDQVMGYMDFVWYMYKTDDGVRHFLTHDHGSFKGKTRGPAFAQAIGTVIDGPHLPTLYDLLIATETGNSVFVAPPATRPDLSALQTIPVPPVAQLLSPDQETLAMATDVLAEVQHVVEGVDAAGDEFAVDMANRTS